MCRSTSAANAGSELLAANSRTSVMSSPIIIYTWPQNGEPDNVFLEIKPQGREGSGFGGGWRAAQRTGLSTRQNVRHKIIHSACVPLRAGGVAARQPLPWA